MVIGGRRRVGDGASLGRLLFDAFSRDHVTTKCDRVFHEAAFVSVDFQSVLV